jgi:hypothetical protein
MLFQQMATLPSECPSCRGALAITRLACDSCRTQLEGTFELPVLMRLAPDDLTFVLRFVRTSGSLKEMAGIYGQSYPTIRNRLDAIIEQLRAAETAVTHDAERHAILDAIARGTMSVTAAERRLRALS